MNALEASRKVDFIEEKVNYLEFAYLKLRENCNEDEIDETLSMINQIIFDLEKERSFLHHQLINIELRRKDE